jgi:hypothetical protein
MSRRYTHIRWAPHTPYHDRIFSRQIDIVSETIHNPFQA